MKMNYLFALTLTLSAFAHASGFQAVGPGIYRGARPATTKDYLALKAMGVRTIVDLQGDPLLAAFGIGGESYIDRAMETKVARGYGMKVISIPFNASIGSDDAAEAAMVRVARQMDNPAMQPVYIHCAIGADRTGVMVAVYRIVAQNCTAVEARAEMAADGTVLTPLITLRFVSLLNRLEQQQRLAPVPNRKCPLR